MRIRTLAAVAAVLPAGAGSARAADVAILKSSDVVGWRPALDALRRAAPSHNLTEFDLRNDRTEADRVVGGLKGRTAVLVALGPLAAQAAREGAPEIPLVFAMVQDPGRLNLLGAAGVTGVAFNVPVKNQLAAFRLVNPRAVRIGVIYSSEASARLVQEAQKAAPVVRLLLVERAVASEREIPETLRGMLKGEQAVDALWIPPDPILLGDETRRFLLSETLKAGRPVYSSLAALVSEGALVASGPDPVSTGELAAELVNRLAGAERAARIEMAVPRGELVVNKRIADKMKIEIPPDALKAANKVF